MPGAPKSAAGAPRSAAEASQKSFRSIYSGGTSIAQPRRVPLLLGVGAGAAMAVVVLIVVWLSGNDAAKRPGDTDQQTTLQNQGQGEAATPGEPGQAGRAPEAERPRSGAQAVQPTDQALGNAVQALGSQLRNERLWSTVTIDQSNPSVVIIQSSLCDDADLTRIVTGALSELKSHGASVVRCMAPHGGIIFEKTP